MSPNNRVLLDSVLLAFFMVCRYCYDDTGTFLLTSIGCEAFWKFLSIDKLLLLTRVVLFLNYYFKISQRADVLLLLINCIHATVQKYFLRFQIEMGSTNVRIGSTIFGPREYAKKQ